MIDPVELTSNRIYDPIASTYALSWDARFLGFLEMQLLKRYAKVTDVCLDIGVANGIFAIPLSGLVQEVHGIDISSKMLEQCRINIERAQVKNVYVYERSATNTLFPVESFDIVYSFATLLLVPGVTRAYQEIIRVLKSNGHAILDITGKYNLSSVYWRRYYKQHGHWGLNAYALPEICRLLESIGFQIVEVHAFGLLDQWKYLPGKRLLTFLDKLFHATVQEPDLDYRISQKFPALANRWVLVLKKTR